MLGVGAAVSVPVFEAASDVPRAGVLVAIPALLLSLASLQKAHCGNGSPAMVRAAACLPQAKAKL